MLEIVLLNRKIRLEIKKIALTYKHNSSWRSTPVTVFSKSPG